MAVSNLKNAANIPANTQGILASASMKDTFYKWLSEGHSKQHRPSSVIANLESVSARFIKRKISDVSIWEITSPEAFIAVHKKANKDKIFCIFTGYKGLKFVNECCELFFAFLRISRATTQSTSIISAKTTVEEATSVAPNNEADSINDESTDLRPLTQPKCSLTIKDGMVEFSVSHKGEIKARREICEELSKKYGFPLNSILPADYEISRNNVLPKLFRRVGHGMFECLGYNPTGTIYRNSSDVGNLLDSNEQKKARHIVATKFKSGYRTSSGIDFERYKNYYESEYGEELTYGADRLDSFLFSIAVIFDDRAYVYDDEVVGSVRTLLEQMDSPCIYINIFFEKHSDELYSFDIFSIDMLKAFIEKNYADIFCKWDYIYLQSDASPAALIREVFNEREAWSYDELSRRLSCIKMNTIKQTLNREGYFRVDVSTYTHIDNMDLPESEGAKIVAFVSERLVDKDYVIANELELSKFESLNPHCPFSTIRDAFFYKFLSHSYDKSGQVITRKGVRLRVLDILEQYCRENETVSFDELNNFEATFDPEGRTHSQCLIAAHNTMVRVSDALFVADSKVRFDVEKIDEALALCCRDGFIPIKSVTDFLLFPYTGYGWNLFLLESFVRKYSRIFKFDVRAVNSANIGVIVRNSFVYNEYDDILATALAKSSVSLGSKREVSDYLFDNGYIGWRSLGKNEGKILTKAKMLRKGGAV